MKKLILLFLPLIVACSKDGVSQTLIPFPNQETVYQNTAPSNGKRIYLIPGFGGTKDVYDTAPFADWISNLKAAGYQVVTFNLPPNWPIDPFSIDGGAHYSKSYEAYLRDLVQRMDDTEGVRENIMGGVSFGGLHSLMGTILCPDLFTKYFASLPVTYYTALTELSHGSDANFNPFLHPEILASKPGFIQYGEQDMRVNWHLTVDLVNKIDEFPNQLTVIDLGQVGHSSTPENLQNILDWLASQ